MLNRFRSSLHSKVHDAKINRLNRQASGDANIDEYEYDTSSASSSASDLEELRPAQPCDFAVEFAVLSVVDLRSSPAYFYVCIGERGELTSRKKKRGIQSSSVYHSRSPALDKCTFILPLGGLVCPEVTIRFCRSSIVGPDSFLGECMFGIHVKGVDSLAEFCATRLVGGSNGYISVKWKIVPYSPDSSNRRSSTILPIEEVSETDRLNALVESVNKCIASLIGDVDDAQFRIDWLVDLINAFSSEEAEFVFLRVSLDDIAKIMPLSVVVRPHLSGQVRARIVKAIQMGGSANEDVLADLITSCPEEGISELKFLLNRGGDKFNLVHLLFNGPIHSESVRERILAKLVSCKSERPLIMSEIDQVVYSPFGSCKLWAEGPIPGFKSLFENLGSETTFISSKPISFQSWTRKLIREIGMQDAPVLAGAKADLYAIRGGISKLHAKVEDRKHTNWSTYKQIFGEQARFIWFGSNRDFAVSLLQETKGLIAFIMENRKSPKEIKPNMFLCGNFVQATLICYQRGYLSGATIDAKILPEFEIMLNNMEKTLSKKNKRHRNLIRDRLADLKRDLHLLQSYTHNEADTAYFEDTADLVDSLVLTPIEARSPCLTNHSPSPDTSLTDEVEFVIKLV